MVLREFKDGINKLVTNLISKSTSNDIAKDKRLTQRPVFEVFFNERAGIRHPEVTPTLPLLQYVHNNSPAIKIATLRLRESIFRRGFEWERVFESKCNDCHKEFQDILQKCDACGSTNIRLPDSGEIKRADKFFEKTTIYDQHEAGKRKLLHLLKQIEDDINIYDDAYIIGIKEYWQDTEGDIKLTTLHQLVRGNPVTMRLVCDELGDPGGKWWSCLRHRDVIEEIPDKKCPKCGRKLYEIHYVSVEGGGDSPMAYYIGDEVIHACYDNQTEVLTENGFKLFKDLNNNDKIATLNKENHNLEYQLPMEIQSYDYNGEMYNINRRSVNLSITPNHRMYVARQHHKDDFEFIEAQNLNKHSYYFKKDCEWFGVESEYFILPNLKRKDNLGILDKRFDDVKIPMDLWLEFLGYFISEGSCSYRENDRYHISIAQSKLANPKKYEKIEKCLDKLSRYWYKDEGGFGLTNKQLATYLNPLGKSHDKYIPQEFLNLSTRQLGILFESLILGDGSICSKYCMYVTSSKKLADQIYEIGIKCGYTSHLSIKIIDDTNNTGTIDGREVKFKNGEMYTIYFGGYLGNTDVGNPEIKTSYIIKSEYNGKVYCCTVPNGIILVRRNGIHIWCGNSKYSPSSLYGFSPIVTLWQYALTLTNMIEYIYRSYTEAHLPKGVLAMRTANPDSAYEFWRDVDDKLQKDKHYIPKMFLEGDGNGTGSGMEFIKFMDTLEEMQFIPVRDEIRRTIASMYGVTNIFIGDTAGVGGLNSEGTQLDITNMAAEAGIAVYNEHIMPELLKWLNIKDWKYVLQSPFEENVQRKLNENQTQVAIAQTMLGMGFDVALGEEDVFEFVYSGTAQKQDQSGGGMGGFQDGGIGGVSTAQDAHSVPTGGFSGNPEGQTNQLNESDLKMGLMKEKVIIKHPSEAPQGVKIRRNNNNQLYYEKDPQPRQKTPGEMQKEEEIIKQKRKDELLERATKHYENLLSEYKNSKDINPQHAMSLQSDLQDAREMVQNLHRHCQDELVDKESHDRDSLIEGRNVNINIQKYLGEEEDIYQIKKFNEELNKIFEEEISKIINSKQKFSENEIKIFAKRCVDDAIWKMETHTRRFIEKAYVSGQEHVESMAKQAIDFSKVDKDAIAAILSKHVLWNSYENVSKSTSEKFNDVITRGFSDPKTFSVQNLVKEMREISKGEAYRFERIARTEVHTAAMKGREVSFQKTDPEGKNLYKWAVRKDSRTSSVCKAIDEQVEHEGDGRGVSLQRLVEILKENAAKYHPELEYRDFMIHPNCRSGLVRSFD